MTEWNHRLIVVASTEKQTSANLAASEWDPDTGGNRTFDIVSYAELGHEEPSHSVVNTAATDGMQTKIYAALGKGEVGSVVDISDWDWDFERFDAEVRKLGLEEIPSALEPVEMRIVHSTD